MLEKINFRNGVILSSSTLNEVQKGTTFNPRLPRDDYYGLPTTANESIWYISERDGIKDWELADPDIETQSNIGRLAYDGVILGCQNCDIESLEEETTFLEIQYGPPRVTYRDIDGSLLPSGSDDSRSIAVFVNSGSYLNDQGQRTSWGLSTVVVDEGTNYIYFDIINQIVVANSVLPNKTKPHIPLALLEISPLVETDEEGNPLEDPEVSRFTYTDLRPGVFIYSDSKIDLNNREDIVIDDYTLESWERIFVDTSNGSVNITLPLSPVDGDRVAIFDVSGRFDVYPVSLYVDNSTDQTILREYIDWELDKKFSNTELIYYEPLNIWIFSDHDLNLGAKERLGDYISCGGIECIGTVDPEDCPNNQQIPAVFPNPSEGFYEYRIDGKCYKNIKDSIAIYSDGEGGFIKVFDSPRCDRSLVDPRPLGIDSKTIYVDSVLGNDGIENRGLRADKPLRTIERALLEAVKGRNKYSISLAPGEYYIDNRPSLTLSGTYGNQKSGFHNLLENTSSLRVLYYNNEEKLLAVYGEDQECTDLPFGLELGRVIYNESGAFGTIVYAERDKKCIKDCGWRFTLEGVYGEFKTNELLYYNDISSINSSEGGVIVPKGVSIIGSDIRKTVIRPIYVPDINGSHSYIFKLSANSYISDLTIGDNLSIKRSHDNLTSLSFVSQDDMIDDIEADNRSYYYRVSALINDPSLAIRYKNNIDSEIVAPAPNDKSIRSQDTRENLTGDSYSDKEGHPDLIRHPGAISIVSTENPEGLSNIPIPDINSSYSGSPYIRNCTVRSIFGLNGLHADGSLVSGFKSIIADSLTIISIQVDPKAYIGEELGYNNDPTSAVASKEYKPERRNFAYKASNQAFIQTSSSFVVGAADHFVTETGGEISLIGSNSSFGDTSLRSSGFYKDAFTQDYAEPSLNSRGTIISEIIPPKKASDNLKTRRVFTGLNFLYTLSKSYYQENSNQGTYRLYFESSDLLNPLTAEVPPSIEGMRGYTYTKRNSQNTLYLSGGNDRRNYVYITGVDGTVYKAFPIINSENNNLDDHVQIFKYDPDPVAQLQENTIQIGLGVVNLTTNTVSIDVTSEEINQAIQSIKRNSFIEINENLYQVAAVTSSNNIATIDLLDTLSSSLTSGLVYTVNLVKNVTDGGRWYIEVENRGLDSSVSNKFISEALSGSTQEIKIQDNQSIFIIRDVDNRLPEEKIYRIKLEGYLSSLGLRLPQTSYIIQKQEDLSNGLISEQNPYVLTNIKSTDLDGTYIACIVHGDQYRKSLTSELYTESDLDNPEDYSLEQSITKEAIQSFLDDFELELLDLNREPVATLEPSNSSYIVYVRNKLNNLTELRIKLHRPSLIRSSSHQWEWVGYLAYDTALPKFQGPNFSQEVTLKKQFNESSGGLVWASGNDQDGNFYINSSVIKDETDSFTSSTTINETEAQEIAPQDTIVVNKELRMGAGSSTYFASNSSLVFYGNNYFLDNSEQPININSNYSILATNNRAGLTQLSDTEEVINSLREIDPEIAGDRVITSAILASDSLKASSTKRGLVALATDPDDENEEFKVVTPALLKNFFSATSDKKGFVTLAPPGKLTNLETSDVAVVPANLKELSQYRLGISKICDIRLSHSATDSIPTVNNTTPNYLSSIYVHGSQIGLYDEVDGWFLKTINEILSFDCNFLIDPNVYSALSDGFTYELFLSIDSNENLILSAKSILQTTLVKQDDVLVDSENLGKRYVGRLTAKNQTLNSTSYLQYLGGELNNSSEPDGPLDNTLVQPTIGLINYYNRELVGVSYLLNNELDYKYKYLNNNGQVVYNNDFSSLAGEIDITTNYNSLIRGNLSITNGRFNKELKNIERFVRVYDWVSDTTAWSSVGTKISAGTEPQFKFMDMSKDGTTIAVGTRTKNETINNSGNLEVSYSGAVRVYRLTNSVWTKIGSDLEVYSSSAIFKGYSVCLSEDGNTLLVRTYNKENNSSEYESFLRAYTFSNLEWSQPMTVGSNSVSSPVLSNGSIAISDDGTVVAESYGPGATEVVVYSYDSNTSLWSQKGNAITGGSGDKTGWSISLNSDGSKIAIGSPGVNNNRGQVRIYLYNTGTWGLVGTNNSLLEGSEENDYYGFSVSLSSIGNMLSVGAPGAYKNRGFAKVYNLIGSSWAQLDGIIEGTGAGDEFGASVSLSSEASKVVSVGARFRDSLGENSGQVISYSEKSTGAPWTAKGLSINGYGKDYEFGWLVDLSSAGTRVAIGTKDGEENKGLQSLSEDSLISRSKLDAITVQVKPNISQKSESTFIDYESTNYYTTGETSYESSSANSVFNFPTSETAHRIKLKYDYRISSISDESLIPEYGDSTLRKYKLNLTDDPHSKNGMIVTVEV